MKGALIILIAIVAIGILLYIGECRWRRRNAGPDSVANSASSDSGADEKSGEVSGEEGEVCCGQHLVCEKDLLSPMTAEIEYYDDEELDRFIGRDGTDYSEEETEEFRDVLMTLQSGDIAGWARSITQRRLVLPPDVRDELLMLVNEQRERLRVKG